MTSQSEAPVWQCLLICWGDKYDSEYINHTFDAVRRHMKRPARFVLITDRPRPGLAEDVLEVEFDPWYLRKEFTTTSLQAKLVMFEKGLVPEDLPCVFLDLDTAIFGDVSQGIDLMTSRKSVLMLQSVILPFGWAGRLVYRLTNKKRYARGNASVVIFHPAECHYIAEEFRRLYDEHGHFVIRPMIADERFISWIAQMHMIRVPNWFAVKFLNEYMHSGKWLVYLKGALPSIRKRRDNLVAVTLPGPTIKPEALLTYKSGDEVKDDKNRWLLWNEAALGNMGHRLQDYFRPLAEKIEANKSRRK